MNISQLKTFIQMASDIHFQLPSGASVPSHFHITEVGLIQKHFIDCGGTERLEKTVNFQLWSAHDLDHRLSPQKWLDIIRLAEEKINLEDVNIEVEYQGETIGKYDLAFNGHAFLLLNKSTACLAEDQCGIPPVKQSVSLADLQLQKNTCTPGGGCC